MSNVSMAVDTIYTEIEGRHVLEVGCGSGEFSLEAARGAAQVECLDLTAARLLDAVRETANINFWEMDAAEMPFADDSIDTAVMYNAAGHIGDKLPQVVAECLRVVRHGGGVHIISSWMLDKCAINDDVLPYLRGKELPFTRREVGSLLMVRIAKE